MIGYLHNSTFNVNKISKDNDSRTLIIDAKIGDAFVLINLFNSNIEAEQLQTFSSLTSYLKIFVWTLHKMLKTIH